MKTTMKFFVRKESNKKGKYPIYIRVLHKNTKAEGVVNLPPISMKDLLSWNKEFSRFEKPNESNKFINLFLDSIEQAFHKLLYNEKQNLFYLTAKNIRDELLERNNVESNTLEYEMKEYLKNTIMKDKNLEDGTKRNYNKAFNHFFDFLKEYSIIKIELKEFGAKEAMDFCDYLKSKMSDVSAQSILKNVKVFFRRAWLSDKILKSPFIKVIIKAKPVNQPKINHLHFKRLMNVSSKGFNNIELYKDIFAVMCMTGLPYSDLYEIKRKGFLDYDAKKFLDINRIKTQIPIKQFMPTKVISILEKYKNHPHIQMNDFLVPKRSLNEINKKLKIIGLLAEIEYPLTTYHARRFFRQSIYKAGIKDEVVRKTLMGHSTAGLIDAFYLDVDDDILMDASVKINSYFEKILK